MLLLAFAEHKLNQNECLFACKDDLSDAAHSGRSKTCCVVRNLFVSLTVFMHFEDIAMTILTMTST